ncbi:hypothetical protein DOFOFD_11780 [Acetobacteraceae bacterium EV16P]|uniref:HTH iclR-type domain-containing protein n=1 Tax=Sorlinia euscelidii TaxID=3081148 RepID=A0ABU7U5Z4_9PROT
MLRLSKLADYAAVLLVQLGQLDTLATASSLAQSTGVPEPTVAKLLKGLAGDGLVTSFRGRAADIVSVDRLIRSQSHQSLRR